MKKIFYTIVIILITISCASTQHRINKNNITTNRLVNKLFKNNGNAFYIESTHVMVSTVWTYYENELKIYKINNGKIKLIQNFERDSIIKYTLNEDDLSPLEDCLEIDGDILGYKIYNNGNNIEKSIPINITCLKSKKCLPDFFKQLIKDINKYKLDAY